MTLTLDAGQAALAQRPSVSCVPLVVLETFSDRDARTVASTYYWTRGRAIIYEWDGSNAVRFEPLIETVSPIARGFSHLPDQGDYSTRETLRLAIDATPQAGTYLWKTLLADKLIGARITVGSLLVDELDADSSATDLEALGRVHEVRWRGEVTSVPELDADSNLFEILAETEEMKITATRKMVGVPTAHPKDSGKPYPVPIGNQNVRALWFDGGGTGSLRESLGTSGTTATLVLEDASTWPDEAYSPSGVGARDQTFAGFIFIDQNWFTFETSTVDLTDNTVDLTGINDFLIVNTRVTYDEGTRVGFMPYRPTYAISAAPVSGVGRVLLGNNDASSYFAQVDLQSFDNDSAGWLVNDPNGDPGGHVASIQWDQSNGQAAAWGYGLFDYENVFVEVEVLGTYTVGTTPTTQIDISATVPGDWYTRATHDGVADSFIQWLQPIEESSGLTTVNSPSGSDITFNINGSGAVNAVSHAIRYTFPTPISYPTALEFSVTLDATLRGSLQRFEVSTNTTIASDNDEEADGSLSIPVDRFTTGPDTFRFDLFDPIGEDAPAEVTGEVRDLTFTLIFDTTVAGDFTINGDVVSYVVTETSPAGAHPIDVVELVVDDFLPTAAVSYDATTFATAKTNTPSIGLSFDLARFPTLGELLAAIGFNARTNFVLSETYTGTEIKAYAAETDYDWPAATRTIGSEFRSLTITLKPITEIANRFSGVYDLGPGEDGERLESYRKSLAATENENQLSTKVATADITTSQTDYGARDSIELPFQMLSDETALIDVLGYYATEALRDQVARYSLVVPWWVGYDLEAGDIVTIQPDWETSAVKVRIIQTVFDFDRNGVGLNVEEVT